MKILLKNVLFAKKSYFWFGLAVFETGRQVCVFRFDDLLYWGFAQNTGRIARDGCIR
jgi:hypothetical protein